MSKIAKIVSPATGEVLITLPLPDSLADVSLANYVSFLNEIRGVDYEGALGNPDYTGPNPIVQMARAIGEFCGVPLDKVLRGKLGEAYHEETGLDGGIRSLYGWLVRAICTYKGVPRTGESCKVSYGGQQYEIPYITAAVLSGTPLLPTVETVEAVEAYETVRVYEEMNKTDDDPQGNRAFARYLRTLAVLLRKPGERLPIEPGDRERFIQARMVDFQGMDAKTAVDVDFFLLNTLTLSEVTLPLVGSLTLPLFALALTIQPQSARRGKRLLPTKKLLVPASAGGRSLRRSLNRAGLKRWG